MKFTYMQVPLNRYTFKVPRIREWVEENAEEIVVNLFAGMTRLECEEIRVDLNPEMPATYHMDALAFVEKMFFCRENSWIEKMSYCEEAFGAKDIGTFLLDPPYAYRKSMEMYKGFVASPFNRLKDAIANVIRPGGLVITFGYHSISMSKKRKFVQEHLLVMSHGGAIHDTLAVVERYVPNLTGGNDV